MAQGGSAAVAPEGALDTARRARLREAVADLAPLELQWASGYLAGLADAAGQSDAGPAAAPGADDRPRLTVLYGSQTGNARGVAERLAASAQAKGLAVDLSSLADYRLAKLAQERLAVIVVSTHGEGDPPDDAIDFHGFLHGRRAPPLAQLRYAVLALGDSSYEHYCKTGRDLDERLAALGGTRLADRVECDVDFRADAETWSGRVLDAAASHMAAEGPRAVARLQAVPSRPRYTAAHPFHAEIITNQPLTGRGSGVDVRHIELDLGDSGITYAAGDSLAVRPSNGAALVTPVVQALGLDPEAPVPGPRGERPLAETLRDDYELTLLGRRFLEAWAGLSGAGELAALLADRAAAAAWMKERQVVDVLRQYPARVDAAALLASLRPLTPRLYSIASGPTANPGEVHLTVGVVRYAAWGHDHVGAASAFLAAAAPGERTPVWVEANQRFRLPADDAPIIMIGPGTGVAPFRAFVEEREARGAPGRNWLFFGARHFDTDFLYQLEWLRYRKRGLLNRLDVAFSRDQAGKVYVQHRLLEQAATLYAWLEEGAHVYVCGDAARMAPDVHAALTTAVARASGRSAEGAGEYVDELRRQRRYHRDVY
jgi:sulfite reductase (NADPH) flavoprotein alpha-component